MNQRRSDTSGLRTLLLAAACLAFGCALESCADQELTDPAGVAQPGSVIWKASGFLASNRPGVDSTAVYILDTARVVRALRRQDGAVIWERTIPRTGSAFIEDVLVVRGTVVVPQSDLIGLDPRNGATRWTFSDASQPGSLWLASNDSTVFAGCYRGIGQLFAINATNGTARWISSVLPSDIVLAPQDDVRILGPILHGDVIVSSFVRWRPDSFERRGGIAAVDARSGRLIWSRMLPVPAPEKSTFPSVAAVSDEVVAVAAQDGNVYGLNPMDGSTRWTLPPFQSPSGPVTPDERLVAAQGGVVVVTSQAGLGTVVAVAANDGHEIWQAEPNLGAILGTLLIDSGQVFSHHALGQISAIDVQSGVIRWKLNVPQIGFFASRIAGDTLYAIGTGAWAIKAR